MSGCSPNSGQDDVTPRLVGGPCEGCEAVFEYGRRQLQPTDTLPGFEEPGQQIRISGTIFKPDGKTPAKDVILYVYHTNQNGLYEIEEDASGWARRHGYRRGWVKTAADGRYQFYTVIPGAYPDRQSPIHIHPTILEPDGRYYWLGSFLFADDPLLSSRHISSSPRGGDPEVLELKSEKGMLTGHRNITLGKNVPDY